ncbi:hypothetical protein [Elizabethkingia argenteiflava]|nr:hypothetical protein [Elizabethkingia argenteiflava]
MQHLAENFRTTLFDNRNKALPAERDFNALYINKQSSIGSQF